MFYNNSKAIEERIDGILILPIICEMRVYEDVRDECVLLQLSSSVIMASCSFLPSDKGAAYTIPGISYSSIINSTSSSSRILRKCK